MNKAFRRTWFWLGVGAVALGCDAGPGSSGNPDAGSPQGTLASPLATEPPEPLHVPIPTDRPDAGPVPDAAVIGILADPSGRLLLPEAGAPPPEPLRADEPLPVEAPGTKDTNGVSLEGIVRWRDVPPPTKVPETSAEGVKEAQKATSLTYRVDITDTGRMRLAITSQAMPFPARTELRARADRYGHLLLWPNTTAYRVVPVGALRPLFAERRIDVTPLVAGASTPQGEGRKLGVAIRKVDVSGPLGSVRIEIAKMPESGEGGQLYCRMLVELVGVDPKIQTCQSSEVPLSAAYTWQDGGGVTWEITSFTKRADFTPSDFVVPPPGAVHTPSGLPIAPGGVFLTREALAALRTGPGAAPAQPDPSAPGEGLTAVNQTDLLLYVLLDGVPTALVPPYSEKYVIGPQRGRYGAQWRSFLGEKVVPPSPIEVPARIMLGGSPDAGAPPPADAGN